MGQAMLASGTLHGHTVTIQNGGTYTQRYGLYAGLCTLEISARIGVESAGIIMDADVEVPTPIMKAL
jgi:hypothetical protein